MTTRRTFLQAASAAPLAIAVAEGQTVQRKGRLKQSATMGCFGGMNVEEACKVAVKLGLKGIDLVGANHWPTLKKYGLIPTMIPAAGHGLTDGINDKNRHAEIEPKFREMLDRTAAFGAPNLIALSGNRHGMSDEEGADNCVAFLSKVKAQAEDKGVTICLELLNSKVDHKDYQCDSTAWGVSVMKRVNSPRVKLLYDIYHMEIMEGDIIRTIRENIKYIGHFHTAGNPGRHEITGDQELNYKPIALAVAELNFQGYFAHEYSPVNDAVKSLDAAVSLCDV